MTSGIMNAEQLEKAIKEDVEWGLGKKTKMRLIQRIERSEEQIKAGKYTKADTSMSDEEIESYLSV